MSVFIDYSSVVKNVLICCFFTSALFGSNLTLAQNETAESEPTNNVITLPGIGGGPKNQTRYNFTAEEFFYPIKPHAVRDHLPERLTFEVVRDMDLETLKSKLQEQSWKTVFHCNGRALTVDMFRNTRHLDGVTNQSVVNNYSFNGDQGVMNQTLYPSEENPDRYPEIGFRTSNIDSIDNLGEGNFNFEFNRYTPSVFTIIKVRETNEILIQSVNVNSPGVCPDGKLPAALLVPFNNLMS